MTGIYFCNLYFNKLFKELTEKQELIPINQKLQVFLVHFYLYAWKKFLQLMYRELNIIGFPISAYLSKKILHYCTRQFKFI